MTRRFGSLRGRRMLPACLAVLAIGALSAMAWGDAVRAVPSTVDPNVVADNGDTAWMLISTALVMVMMPGLALFYAGMVRRKNVLGTMMHSMAALGIIGIEWVVIGYAMAFGQDQHGLIGWDWKLLFLQGIGPDDVHATPRRRNLCSSCSRACSPSSRPPLSPAPLPNASSSAPSPSSPSSGACSSTTRWPTGSGAAAGWADRAPCGFHVGRHRLRRRHGRAYFRRLLGPGRGPLHRQTHRLSRRASCSPTR